MTGRINWAPVIEHAAIIADSYSTPITLRQLFYRLVVEQSIANKESTYKRLSDLTAKARRARDFPPLADLTRRIDLAPSWTRPGDILADLAAHYRCDRTEGQTWTVVLGVEKRGMTAQLIDWFGDERGVPVVALAGYDSESHIAEVRRLVLRQARPAVLLYAGDFDPSGEDILRDYAERSGCWDKIRHIALTDEQVARYELPENPGKTTDSRASAFAARHGRLVQVELDALDPEDLRQLYADATAEFWDESPYRDVMVRERADREALQEFTQRWRQP